MSIYCHQKLKLTTSDLLSTKPARSFLNLSWSKHVISSGIVCESSSAAILERKAWQSASASATNDKRLGIMRRQRACRVSFCALIALLCAFPARTSYTAPGPCSPISPHMSASPEPFMLQDRWADIQNTPRWSVSYLSTAVRVGLYTWQVSLLREHLQSCPEQIPLCRWRLHFRARGCHSLEYVTYLRHLKRLTAIIHSKQPWRLTFVHRHTRYYTVLNYVLTNVFIIMLS